MSQTTTVTSTDTRTGVLTFGDDRDRQLPTVEVFDASSVNHDQILAALIKAGGCIIRKAVNDEVINTIERETRPEIEGGQEFKGSFFPPQTRRVNGLASKSKVFIDKIVNYKPYQDVCSTLLSSTQTSWVGEERKTSTSVPQLNNTIIFSIGPGATAQGLHRDDMIHHNITSRMESSEYKIGQDAGIGFFVGAKRTTRRNGATRFIPGSHLWDHETPPSESLAFYAELEPGDGFIMLSSCYHGGSANTTTDEERLVYSCFMTKGYLRQEENQYLNNDPKKLVELHDDAMLKMIGYNLSNPFLGWIKGGHPLQALGRAIPSGDMY